MWIIGVIINLLGSLSINLATNLIKLAHSRLADAAEKRGHPSPPFRRSPRKWWAFPGNALWAGGLLLFAGGNLANFASFAFAAQSLLSALGAVQFISNVAFSRFINKEPVKCRVLVATAVIVAGCVMLVAFGNHESPKYTAAQLQKLYGNPGYIAYACAGGATVVVAYIVYRIGKRRTRGLSGDALKGPWARWLPICYALFSGILGTQAVLYGKSMSLLLRTTATGEPQFGYWYTWLVVVIFLAAAAFWMTRFNKALRLFAVSKMMPLLQVSWVLFSMLSGSIYYQEFKDLSTLAISMFGAGTAVLLAGVWVLTTTTASRAAPAPAPAPEGAAAPEEQAKELGAAPEGLSDEGKGAPALEEVVVHPRRTSVARRLTAALLQVVHDDIAVDFVASARQAVGCGESPLAPALSPFCMPVQGIPMRSPCRLQSPPRLLIQPPRRHTITVVASSSHGLINGSSSIPATPCPSPAAGVQTVFQDGQSVTGPVMARQQAAQGARVAGRGLAARSVSSPAFLMARHSSEARNDGTSCLF